MTITTLRTLSGLFLRDDDQLSEADARSLAAAARDGGTITADERALLTTLANDSRTSSKAQAVLVEVLKPSTTSSPLRSVSGGNPGRFDDDVLVFGGDGRLSGASGTVPYTRSYAATREGTLTKRHGSVAPKSTVLTATEQQRAATQTPAAALDAAAAARGLRLPQSFTAIASSKSFSDPAAPFWWGKCHAWAWSALSAELSARVDVGGPENQRGLWLDGQWLSRADLGNFLMGVGDSIALRDSNQLFVAEPTAEDLLQATMQYLVEGGGGLVADIHLDAAHGGSREVWNQPFVAADVDTRTVTGSGRDFLLALAKNEGKRGTEVKLVHVVAKYGNEASDAHEGEWNQASRSWNVYAVTDAQGRMTAAYMADDKRLKTARGLPTLTSHELPEYVWKPTLTAVTDALAGRPNATIDADQYGAQFRFFVGTVLTRGVPGATRQRFEAAVAKLPAGRISTADQSKLRASFPGVAEAYSAQQWQRAFGARGLSAQAFGSTAGANSQPLSS